MSGGTSQKGVHWVLSQYTLPKAKKIFGPNLKIFSHFNRATSQTSSTGSPNIPLEEASSAYFTVKDFGDLANIPLSTKFFDEKDQPMVRLSHFIFVNLLHLKFIQSDRLGKFYTVEDEPKFAQELEMSLRYFSAAAEDANLPTLARLANGNPLNIKNYILTLFRKPEDLVNYNELFDGTIRLLLKIGLLLSEVKFEVEYEMKKPFLHCDYDKFVARTIAESTVGEFIEDEGLDVPTYEVDAFLKGQPISVLKGLNVDYHEFFFTVAEQLNTWCGNMRSFVSQLARFITLEEKGVRVLGLFKEQRILFEPATRKRVQITKEQVALLDAILSKGPQKLSSLGFSGSADAARHNRNRLNNLLEKEKMAPIIQSAGKPATISLLENVKILNLL